MSVTNLSIESSDSTDKRLNRIKSALPYSSHLLAVSKNYSVDKVHYMAMLGQISFGESKLQEGLLKQKQLLDFPNLDWHFIGRLQSNKIRKVINNFHTIHSVSSLALAQKLQQSAIEEEYQPQILLQIKLISDVNKVGFSYTELIESWHILTLLKPLNLIGLMCIAPLDLQPKYRRKLFAKCRELVKILGLKECSMGMSNDWREAVIEGSHYVRIGSALFNNNERL
uniref:Pyridoxal phosphate homeostasis protein n=1 Tax=Paulinella chromatophora TaxID=39717 RepID=B1X3J0_PAUCH|nr:hypothetical protein PCC_0050 [Paulinella chromatophora]ACB42509.1 hypothetical protein PCC_0050 [Paulinella chromatophora]